MFGGALLGAVAGGLLVCLGKVGRRYPMPFETFMAAGSVIALLFGPQLWGTYPGHVGRS